MGKRSYTLLLMLLLLPQWRCVASSPHSERFTVSFRAFNALLMKQYESNERELSRFNGILSNPQMFFAIDSIVVLSSVSVDGDFVTNMEFGTKRGVAVRGYIMWQFPHFDRDKIVMRNVIKQPREYTRTSSITIYYRQPQESPAEISDTHEPAVTEHEDFSQQQSEREEIAVPQVDTIIKQEIVVPEKVIIEPPVTEQLNVSEPMSQSNMLSIEKPTQSSPFQIKEQRQSAPPVRSQQFTYHYNLPGVQKEVATFSRKPLLAIKTNLLFDAASLVNLELEIPLSRRLSVAGECIFPWWNWDNGMVDSKRHRIQVFSENIELRYWLGNRTLRPNLDGWFVGVYTGLGMYDFEYNKKGYQGEFFIAAGASVGFAHRIGRSLSLEYSLGLGYMRTDYRRYESYYGVDGLWHPIRKENGTHMWIGPTRVKVSLVWILNMREGGNK